MAGVGRLGLVAGRVASVHDWGMMRVRRNWVALRAKCWSPIDVGGAGLLRFGAIVLNCEVRSVLLLLVCPHGLSARVRQDTLASGWLGLGRRMGGGWKLLGFIADWEPGTRIDCNSGANLAGNIH